MEHMEQETRETPSWERTLTMVVFVLAVVSFVYLGQAYYTQRSFARLMTELVSVDEDVSRRAADELASTDDALPYLTNALVNARAPEKRVLCATVILRHVEARRGEAGTFRTEERRQRVLRAGLDLEALTKALEDESSVVRAKAHEVVTIVGLEESYQKNRLSDCLRFEGLLTKLSEGTPVDRDAAAEELRQEGIRSLPYLVGVVFVEDADVRLRGLKVLRTVVQDVLRGSNQRRIVTLLGRRRCRLLLRETVRLAEADRSVITDILNVSGRIPEAFFTLFIQHYTSLTDDEARYEMLTGRIDLLEDLENVRATGEDLAEKIKRLHEATGGTR